MKEILHSIATKELIDEIQQREGVKEIIIEPYQKKEISAEGPMIILEIID